MIKIDDTQNASGVSVQTLSVRFIAKNRIKVSYSEMSVSAIAKSYNDNIKRGTIIGKYRQHFEMEIWEQRSFHVSYFCHNFLVKHFSFMFICMARW